MEGSFIEVLEKVVWYIFLGGFVTVILLFLIALMRGVVVFLTLIATSAGIGLGLGWCANEATLLLGVYSEFAATFGIIVAFATSVLVFLRLGEKLPEAWFYNDD